MTRDEMIEAAKRHLGRADELLGEMDRALHAGDRMEIVRLQGGEAVARAAAHAALGQGYLMLGSAERPKTDLCGHGNVALPMFDVNGVRPSRWVHVYNMAPCDRPPTY